MPPKKESKALATKNSSSVVQMPTAEEQLEGLNEAVASFQKQFGVGSLLSSPQVNRGVKWIDLSSFEISEAFGKGFPRGRVIEIFGAESSGKTSLATYLAGQCQKYWFADKGRYGRVLYLDMEHAFEPDYAPSLGLDPAMTMFVQPDVGEQCLQMAEAALKSGKWDLIVVDSVATLVPQAELDGEIGDAFVGLQARLMSQALRKINSALGPTTASLIFVNQTRMKIGQKNMPGMPPPETTSGGNALKFYASVRIQVKKKEYILAKDETATGVVSLLSFVKNKVAPPFRKVELRLIFGKGYDFESEYFGFLKRYGLIKSEPGSWYTIPGGELVGSPIQVEEDVPKKEGGGTRWVDQRFNGQGQVMDYLKNNRTVFELLKAKCRDLFKTSVSVTVEKYQAEKDTAVPDLAEGDEIPEEEDGPWPTPDNPVVMINAPRRPAVSTTEPKVEKPELQQAVSQEAGSAPELNDVPVESTESEPEPELEQETVPASSSSAEATSTADPSESKPEDDTPVAPETLVKGSEEWKAWNVAHGLTPTGRKKITYGKRIPENEGSVEGDDSMELPKIPTSAFQG